MNIKFNFLLFILASVLSTVSAQQTLIQMDKQAYTMSDTLSIKVTITNNTKKRIHLPYYCENLRYTNNYPPYFLNIINAHSLNKIDTWAKIKLLRPKNKLLRPNEVFVITFKIPINSLWEFNATKIATANNPTAIKGGEYSVQLQLGFPYNKKSSTTLESNKLDFIISNE